jgi:1,2-diacylglycerol 3-beta-glucosyltransferase
MSPLVWAGVLAGTALGVLALVTLLPALYLLGLTLFSARLPRRPPPQRHPCFDVVIPARNESAVLLNCLHSLQRLDWPRDRLRLRVIADNCDDATAQVARDAGVAVLERHHATERGKGYALRLAFDTSRDEGWADAVVVIDADSVVSPNLLRVFAAQLEAGAPAVQAHYGVRNPDASWRTGLMAIAYGAFHSLRSNARERLGLSSGLRGNGWCVTHRTLRAVPYHAFSFIEDVEYGLALGLAGLRVHYAPEAEVLANMEVQESVALRQRQRWESGRPTLLRRKLPEMLAALRRHRPALVLDLAADLMVLPLAYLLLQFLALTLFSALLVPWLPIAEWTLAMGVFGLVVPVVYGLRGWQLSGRGFAGCADLCHVPAYIGWKLWRVLRRDDRGEWNPSRRQAP